MSSEDKEIAKTVTHRIEVNRNPEIDALHDENAILKAKLESASLYEVERQKNELKEKYTEYKDEIEDLKTPQEMDKFKLRVFNDKVHEKPRKEAPSGKASIIPPNKMGEQEYESQTQMVDHLYDVAYYSSKKYSPEEVSDAKEKIKTLLRSIVGGSAWKEMREHGTGKIEQHKLGSCVKCHYTLIDTDKCPNCGYDPTEKQKVRD
jgi:rubrerythrin